MDGGTDATGHGPARLGWLLRFGVAAVLVILGANVAVGVAERRLPDPNPYFGARTRDLVTDMDRMQAAGKRSDIVFAGTSQAARGIDPRIVGPALGLPWVANIALPGSQSPVTRRWLLEEVEPRLKPRRVVWGISSIDFNGKRPDPGLAHYDAALATRPGMLGKADELFADNFPVARHRSQLRDPYGLAQTLKHPLPKVTRHQPLKALFGPLFKAPASAVGRQSELNYLDSTLLAHFTVTPEYLEAYRSTLEQLRRDGVETAVVIMPVSSQLRAAHPKGAAQYEAWKRLAVKAAKATGTTVIDLDRSMPDTDFSDYVHLTPVAARTFSTLLAQRLAALGWSKKTP